jgi:hypothetical protein
MTRSHVAALALAGGLVWASASTPGYAQVAPARVLAEDFSNGLDAWDEQRLDRRSTEYRIVEVDGDAVLKSASNDAAAALILPLRSGPVAPGRLRWRWRVLTSLTENSRETEQQGDDYAARVFVLFGNAELAEGTRAIAYAWAGRQPVGSTYPNPYLSDVATVVLQSGNARAREWVMEDRDLATDYEHAFGEPAPDVAAVAILVDTDDTGGAAMAWFDDLELWVPPTDGPS